MPTSKQLRVTRRSPSPSDGGTSSGYYELVPDVFREHEAGLTAPAPRGPATRERARRRVRRAASHTR